MQPLIVLSSQPEEAGRTAILAALLAYSHEACGPSGYEEVAALLRHPEPGATIVGAMLLSKVD